MTFLQIQYAIECAVSGSFSKAAQNLYASSSNLSKMINALEEELGFSLFVRNHNGITPTPDGMEFLEHANRIMDEMKQIEQLHQAAPGNELFVACQYNPFCLDAFTQVVSEITEKEKNYKLTFHVCTDSDCIEMVKQRQCDVAITTMPNPFVKEYLELLKFHGLESRELRRLPFCVYVRREHPVLKEYREGEDFDFTRMHAYPYVALSRDRFASLSFSPRPEVQPGTIDKSKMICVNRHNLREQIIDSTDAFGIGVLLPENIMERYGRAVIPIPGSFAVMHSITSPKAESNPDVEHFLSFLK